MLPDLIAERSRALDVVGQITESPCPRCSALRPLRALWPQMVGGSDGAAFDAVVKATGTVLVAAPPAALFSGVCAQRPPGATDAQQPPPQPRGLGCLQAPTAAESRWVSSGLGGVALVRRHSLCCGLTATEAKRQPRRLRPRASILHVGLPRARRAPCKTHWGQVYRVDWGPARAQDKGRPRLSGDGDLYRGPGGWGGRGREKKRFVYLKSTSNFGPL